MEEVIRPLTIDSNVRFSSIGGLKEHIKCLREMIIFPLMYPELFKRFNTRPAKGILFHGPPGTGKTLLARALANECSLVGGRRVSFFLRKGADVTNKYYGESERILRQVFKTARRMKPSIIFFDEIDALAPERLATAHNHTSSLVATLLNEMDGVCDRGDVVVIGATNRPEAMDPAIRRAGRFDRELYFPPPECDDRREILQIYTKDWEPPLSQETLCHLAEITVGYLGADIKSLCSEAVLTAVKRVYPQIYESDCKLLINAKNIDVTFEDMVAAMEDMVPTGARYSPQVARPLPPYTFPLLEIQLEAAAELLNKTFPAKEQNRIRHKRKTCSPYVFLILGECAETLLAPALLAQLESCLVKELSVSSLHAKYESPEQAVVALFAECRRSGRHCAIYVRDLPAVWDLLSNHNAAEVLLEPWRAGSVGNNTLIIATCRQSYSQLPSALQEVFPPYKDCTYRVRKPMECEVASFLMPVVTELPLVPPIVYEPPKPPPLPLAPVGPAENEQDAINRLFREYDNLRMMRGCLWKILFMLRRDRKFQKIGSPSYQQELPDYFNVVQKPMDLELMLTKIEEKRYFCAREFLNDIDLISANAILYDKMRPDASQRDFRQQACRLHSEAAMMVAEEVPAALELECQLVARRRGDKADDMADDIRDSSPDRTMSRPSNQSIRGRPSNYHNDSQRSCGNSYYAKLAGLNLTGSPESGTRHGVKRRHFNELPPIPAKVRKALHGFDLERCTRTADIHRSEPLHLYTVTLTRDTKPVKSKCRDGSSLIRDEEDEICTLFSRAERQKTGTGHSHTDEQQNLGVMLSKDKKRKYGSLSIRDDEEDNSPNKQMFTIHEEPKNNTLLIGDEQQKLGSLVNRDKETRNNSLFTKDEEQGTSSIKKRRDERPKHSRDEEQTNNILFNRDEQHKLGTVVNRDKETKNNSLLTKDEEQGTSSNKNNFIGDERPKKSTLFIRDEEQINNILFNRDEQHKLGTVVNRDKETEKGSVFIKDAEEGNSCIKKRCIRDERPKNSTLFIRDEEKINNILFNRDKQHNFGTVVNSDEETKNGSLFNKDDEDENLTSIDKTKEPETTKKKDENAPRVELIELVRRDSQEKEHPEKPVVVNLHELDRILREYAKPLCQIGLEALIDLHCQLGRTVYRFSHQHDRSQLPAELRAIMNRYIRYARKQPGRSVTQIYCVRPQGSECGSR